ECKDSNNCRWYGHDAQWNTLLRRRLHFLKILIMVKNYVPITEKQKALLHEIYYDDNIYFGRDKLFKYIRANHPDSGISRRDVMEWLKLQRPWQITKRPLKRVKTSLMDIQKPG